jgi:RNA polymerase sigma-54 factor
MKLGLSHSARMEQRLIQSPQMIQAMQILQLSSLDLQERIEQELLENPLLELDEGRREELEPVEGLEGREPPVREEFPTTDGDQRLRDSIRDELDRYERDLEEVRKRNSAEGDEGDRKLEALANTPERPRSLAAALIEQLALVDLDERRRRIAEFLIFSLDDRGYLPEPLEDLAAACSPELVAFELERQRETLSAAELAEVIALEARAVEELVRDEPAPDRAPQAGPSTPAEPSAAAPSTPLLRFAVTAEEVAEVLTLLRHATHPGLGAVDLRDCLLLQLEARGEDQPLVHELVEHWLEDITKNRLPRIAKATGATIEAIKEAIELLRDLDPSPGRQYGEALASTIVPDVIVDDVDGVLEVRLGRQRLPELRVAEGYRELLERASREAAAKRTSAGADPPGRLAGESSSAEPAATPEPEDARRWVRKRYEAARWFIDALAQRKSTVLRIAEALFQHQREFLAKGPSALKPLRMQEIADQVSVHISTVSRAVAGKYAQTPRGIFPLKYFFTSGTTDSSGAESSQVAIQQHIQELVDGEDRNAPLSDEQLAAALVHRHGVKIARRTVTKYRKLLGIASSSERRAF